jgi:hypothetical protein
MQSSVNVAVYPLAQGDQPTWQQHEDFVFSIHSNSNHQLELSVLQANRLSFTKYSKSLTELIVCLSAQHHDNILMIVLGSVHWVFCQTPMCKAGVACALCITACSCQAPMWPMDSV